MKNNKCVFLGAQGRSPRNWRIYPKRGKKRQRKRNFSKRVHKLSENFLFSEANLSRNYSKIHRFLKSFIDLKEIKKPSIKILRVWTKTQLGYEIFEKTFGFT